MDQYVESILASKGVSKVMWGLQYYLKFVGNDDLVRYAGQIRGKKIRKKRRPFKLEKFRGVNMDSMKKLAQIGIVTVDDMLESGNTRSKRQSLSKKTGIELKEILEHAKLSDLARLGGVRSIRGRLYHDAGVDCVEKIASLKDGEELIEITSAFIDRSGFDGIPPTPKEAANAVKDARKLPIVLEL
ncbi:DUF4332 domain-containing protein [Candidatus Thorarchaeota archaeon]|nr:MAG: DUF4332 domain-containing protein [Candidatus Thorarchaeota archaeon]